MKLKQLRIAGFKSFVNETNVPLPDGITVVVGPNGCGKSNIVEAIRWVMGEASAKRMRAKEMDDVIFSGTSGRGRRDFAEVSVMLDNAAADAPPPYQKEPQLEVARRIDRGRGSFYRINGADTRARDVQFLFADQGSGAASSAIVGQGRIAALLEAQPTERRIILEEAAGIRGLQSRKHESELKLQATENNLQKLQDIIDEKQLRNKELLKQAAEAIKYRELSDEISDLERLIAAIEWASLNNRIKTLTQQTTDALKGKTESEVLQAEQAAKVASLTEQLPQLKEKATAAHAHLRQAQLELSRTEDAERRLADELQEWKDRLNENKRHAEHAEQSAKEAQEKHKARSQELADLQAGFKDKKTALQELQPQLEKAEAEQKQLQQKIQTAELSVRQIQEQLSAWQQRLSECEQEKQAQMEKITATEARLQKLKSDSQDWIAENGGASSDSQLAELEKTLQEKTADQEKATKDLQRLRDSLGQLSDAQLQEEVRGESLKAPAREKLQELQTEAQFLKNMLAEFADGEEAVIDLLQPKKSYEKAVAVLLGEAATAGLSPQAKSYWLEMADLPTTALGDLPNATDIVKAPKALMRRLRHSFIANNMKQALSLMPKMQAGQIIVTKDGDLCRWDGYIKSAEQLSAPARNLQHKGRLAEVQKLIPKAQADLAKIEEKIAATAQKKQTERQALQEKITANETAVNQLQAEVRVLYDRRQSLQNQITSEGARHQELQNQITVTEQRLHDYKEAMAAIDARQADMQKSLQDMKKQEDSAGDKRQVELSKWKNDAEILETSLRDLRRRHGLLQGEVQLFDDTQSRLQADLGEWQSRSERELQRQKECLQRVQLAEQKITEYQTRPQDLKTAKSEWLEKISEREEVARQAADALAEKESAVQQAESQGRELQHRLSSLAETHDKAVASLAEKEEQLQGLTESIEERFLLNPSRLLEEVGEGRVDSESAELDKFKALVERLSGRREALGEVNLLAEREAETLAEELTGLDDEREDLQAAVKKLRQAVAKLNAKARERLKEAFASVNENFELLFARLFGGGSAKLDWVGDTDVLEAGIEIVVALPGKRERILSLLSGGEQTLTALALLCAVFVSHPALIFILDEVDALLDDSNVARFCDLLEYLKSEGNVKFLVVSHHRLTMARADRLYGVTMAERGVSSLVAVDMETAEEYISD